jgi:hypothetical protein
MVPDAAGLGVCGMVRVMFDRADTLKQSFAADDSRRAALDYLLQAWEEAILDGIDGDCVANAALFAAFKELVATYGEDAVARFAERLPERVRNGEFTLPGVHQ